MKRRYKLFLPLILCFSLFFGSFAFASSGSGGRGTIWADNSMNSEVISQFNDLSAYEQYQLVEDLFPSIVTKLGLQFKGNVDYYSILNDEWIKQYNRFGDEFSNADDFMENTDYKYPYVFVHYIDGHYEWNSSLADYLATCLSSNNGNLVMSNTSGINYFLKDYADSYLSSNGFQEIEFNSFKNINSSVFGSLDVYNAFVSLCDRYKNDYPFVGFSRNYTDFQFIFISSPNIYRNGESGEFYFTVSGADNRVTSKQIHVNWSGAITSENDVYNAVHGFVAAVDSGPSYINGYGDWSMTNIVLPLVTTMDSRQTLYVPTSLSAWIDSQGHFEYPFTYSRGFGSVPSIVISPSDMTNLYNYYYYDASINGSFNNNNSGSGSGGGSGGGGSGDGSGDGGFSIWDILSGIFDTIVKFIEFVVKGIVTLITSALDILNSLFDVVGNLVETVTNFFTGENGSIINFLKALFSWLPEEISSLFISVFVVSVTFGIIKLIKGALS